MNRVFAASLFDLSSNLPLVLIVAAVVLFAVAFIVALIRSRRPLAVGAVVVIVLLTTGLAATMLTHEPAGQQVASIAAPDVPTVPALACLDELAGAVVETACERAVFSSAETTAAAVSYTAAQISRLESYGDVAAANKAMTPSLRALRRAVERDRFGMVAHVLATRDECTLSKCAFFASLTNTAQIANNMNEHVYDGLVAKHAPVWGQPVPALPPVAGVVALPGEPERPTGKPVSGDFPSSASIPPVSIMAPEPATASVPAKPAEPAHAAPKTAAPKAAAKKPAPSHPRSLTPPAAAAPSTPENNR
jgi:hypothetical protein